MKIWSKITESILSCEECTKTSSLLESTEGLVFPNPYDYCSQLNLLLISWAPPGKPYAVQESHFFHNAATPDRLRTRLFNGLSKARPGLDFDPLSPRSSLEMFYRSGLYLVPTIFRRIKNDARPNTHLVNHSSRVHLQEILDFFLTRQSRLPVILLGETPSRAMGRLFEAQDAGRQILSALRKPNMYLYKLHGSLNWRRRTKKWERAAKRPMRTIS